MNLIFYHRPDCHLCKEMDRALRPLAVELNLVITQIDVESDPELEERYGIQVPVLIHDGSELCHYHLDEAAIRQFVATKRGTC
ncbi:MAG TPA: glutaredoxin family protein [Acidiferrobacter sp.]|nr:glutaredoxin family protein [Acidiferrobacter sp.]